MVVEEAEPQARTSVRPPGEPPRGVTHEMLWRLAARLFGDHTCATAAPGEDGPRCGGCGQPWPCSGRRLAELGLNRASV